MPIFIEENKKIKNIFVNVNGEKKSISSAWMNKDGVPTKVFQQNSQKDLYDVAPIDAINKWNYTLDNENKIVTLNYYIGNEANVTIYGGYEIDGVIYNTKIKSNTSTKYSTKYMFNGMAQSGCQKIETITFGKDVDTSEVTSMVYMFESCYALTTLDISSFDTDNVTDMACMFSNCYKLTALDLSNFNTSNVTDMGNMFANCRALASLDLSSFGTNNVTNMNNMFMNCISLTSLDLTSFDTGKVTDMRYMFQVSIGTSNLCAVYVTEGKWSISQAKTSNMFSGCGTSSVTYK